MIAGNIRSGDEENISLYRHDDSYGERARHRRAEDSSGEKITVLFVVVFAGLMLFAFLRTNSRHQIGETATEAITKTDVDRADQIKAKITAAANVRTPKILWVLTAMDIEGLRMTESLAAKHLIHVGKKSGYDVRVVNSFTAYDWLSPEMTEAVRITKHKSKYILQVHELLRIALLIEHGGLAVKLPRYIFPKNLNWIEELFQQDLETLIKTQKQQGVEYCSSEKQPQIMLFYDVKRGQKVYEDLVIYARRNSTLLRETFEEMSKVATEGNWELKYFLDIQQLDRDVQVKYIKNMFISLVNFRQYYWFTGRSFCEKYQVISINKNAGPFIMKIENDETIRAAFVADKQQFFKKYGEKYMLETDINAMGYQIQQVLYHEKMGISHKNSVFRSDIIEIEGNEWMLTPVNRTREVNFCIISLKPLPVGEHEDLIKRSISNLQLQNFEKWNTIYFVEGLNQTERTWSDAPVRVVNASADEGLNLQRAAIKYCQPNDLGILLNYDETFGTKKDLKVISQQMLNRSNYGAFLSIKHATNIIKPKYSQAKIRRKIQEPNLELLQEIAHSFRVFSIYSYKSIPHMSLHDNYGRYYDREIAFLTLLEMAWEYNRCDQGEMIYHTKRVEQKLEIPKYRITLQNTFINMPTLKTIDLTKHEYISKFSAHTLCGAMNLYLDRKMRSLEDFFILNNGSEFIGYQHRANKTQLIEKKIHQMWVGKEMPKFKQYLTNKNKQNHPDYEYYLWTNDNITRQNFPVSYDLIMTLLEFTKVSRYNKLSMVSDLMRAEIIYNHGGIYIDTNYLIFRKHGLDDWLTFKGMFVSQLYPYHRFQREGTVFAAMKGFDRVKRLIDHRAISTRNHYSSQAHIETGPTFFTHTVIAEEELDPDILQPSFEHLYPYYPWDESNYRNLCEADNNIKEEDIMFRNKLTYRKDCGDRYSWAVGMDFWSEGKTWA